MNIVLVDDEQIIKSGLRKEVDWESAGCRIAGEAADGREALELIRREKPDAVISDIRMPFMDGLTLMEKAREEQPDLYFLFISGHDEFRYVQKALKLGASDYILKPIDPVYLEEKLRSLVEESGMRDRRDAAVEASRRENIRRFLQDVVFGERRDESRLRADARALDSALTESCYRMLSFQVDDYYSYGGGEDESGREMILSSFKELVRFFPAGNRYLLTESPREFDLCLFAGDGETLNALVQAGLDRIEEETAGLSYTVSIGVGDAVLHLERLTRSYQEARKALELRYIKGKSRIFSYEEYSIFSGQIRAKMELGSMESLMKAVSEGNSGAVPDLLKALEKNALVMGDPRSALHWLASGIMLELNRIMEERELSIEEVLDDPFKEWTLLGQQPTAALFMEKLEKQLLSITAYIHMRRDYHSSQILDQAMSYIKEKFASGSLSLEEAAAVACMSPCYFAVIFKQETGRTFNRFLTDLRINKAKDLILYTDLKSYEIGPKVGYDNPSYFSTVFKKNTGMSPSEYRKSFE